ncbi:MAG: Zn-ribbon domain-containing OB-fold protein [Candidatus Methanomethylicia archaeon]
MSTMPTLKSRPMSLSYDIPISRIKQFWDGLKEGKVLATKCKNCGTLNFPPVADCPNCYSSDIEWIPISSEGEIETFTHVVVKPQSFQEYEPYTIAIAKLKDGVRVLAWLTGALIEDVKVGMKVKLKAKISQEGALTYEFTPI